MKLLDTVGWGVTKCNYTLCHDTTRSRRMIETPRSACPINRAVELLGDRWSLLILRDVARHDGRSFRDLLIHSAEGISAPVLSRRLADLVAAGFLSKAEAPRGKQGCYRLTDLGRDAVPVLVELGRLGVRIDPATAEHAPPVDAATARGSGV